MTENKQQQKKLLSGKKEQLELSGKKTLKSDNEKVDKLQIQLDRLDEDTKEVIMLRFYSDLSFRQIAKMRSEPIGTTLSKVHRGLKKLREMMEL